MTSSQSDTFKQSYETLRLFNCELNFEWHAARTSQAEMATLPRASEALSRLQEKKLWKCTKLWSACFKGWLNLRRQIRLLLGFVMALRKSVQKIKFRMDWTSSTFNSSLTKPELPNLLIEETSEAEDCEA